MRQENERALIAVLRSAYSGELAAALAYRGHWHSVNDPERTRIKTIEDEESHHRKLVAEMLAALDAEPLKRKEIRATIVGKALGLLCHLSGWLVPMYGAGKLESRNVREYEQAARYARDSGHEDFIDCLLMMAEVEWEHEFYFRAQVQKHSLGRRLPKWTTPPAKETIRLSFENESGAIVDGAECNVA